MPEIIAPGHVARHVWNGQLTLNERGAWPRIVIEAVDGLRSLPDPDDNRDPATGRWGEVPRAAVRRGKTLTYRGYLEDHQITRLWDLREDVLQAFTPIEEELRMDMVPPAGISAQLPPGIEAPTLFYTARCLQCDVPDRGPDRTAMGWAWPLAIALRMSDARFYDTAEQTGETGPLNIQSGMTFPILKPVVIPAPGGTAGTATITVGGRADVDPVVRLHGPAGNPAIYNDTLGVVLRTRNLALAADSFLEVDFRDRIALLEGQSDYSHKVDLAQSTWWDEGVAGLLPGDNTIRFAGEGMANPARAELRWHNAIY